MYISILDYSIGKVIIVKVPEGTDAESYVREHLDLEGLEYMTTSELSLEIKSDL